ncbi:hypothetical protein QQF64_021941 [Cirrhinus molitorella]|uniref:Uncharacterized protein n=2 Tax=Cirrhinus molitorella TaxID=172907 RepID=A0ABR3L717_9TELE|nr:hypothetical protein Q8A67_024490 [Cirrhinus molitorella]
MQAPVPLCNSISLEMTETYLQELQWLSWAPEESHIDTVHLCQECTPLVSNLSRWIKETKYVELPQHGHA